MSLFASVCSTKRKLPLKAVFNMPFTSSVRLIAVRSTDLAGTSEKKKAFLNHQMYDSGRKLLFAQHACMASKDLTEFIQQKAKIQGGNEMIKVAHYGWKMSDGETSE